MRLPIIALAATMLPTDVVAQQKISGVARDADTRTLLPCIDVGLIGADSSHFYARTHKDGSFSFETTARDSATLFFSSWGIQPVTMKVAGLMKGVDHTAEYAVPIHTAVGLDKTVYTSKDSTEGKVPPFPIPRNSAPTFPMNAWPTDAPNGTIVMRYVVDSLGRVQAPIEAIIGARHNSMVNAIRLWLRRTRFTPGTYRGVPQCEMLTQSFNFSRPQR
ncbi:MAG TPA: hypothetical protein VJR92_03555 [Gemmatimonadaceae bacterium]|nr:hypothetical protein [Gemmatimonadaceae bacterium]